MSWLNLVSLCGWIALGAIAWLVGGARRPVQWRSVLGSGLLMFLLGVIVFWIEQSRVVLLWLNDAVVAALEGSREGAKYLFGPLALGPGETMADGTPSIGFVLAFQILPAVIFFAAVMAVLYHLRLIQPLIRLFARLFRRTVALSGAEA